MVKSGRYMVYAVGFDDSIEYTDDLSFACGLLNAMAEIGDYTKPDMVLELKDTETGEILATKNIHKSFNSMINKVKKGWQPEIDYTTGEQIFRPGYDDEAGSFDNTPEPEQRYKTEDREQRSIQLGDITVDYDFVTTYDAMDGYVISTYSFITSMETPLGTTDDIHSRSGYSSHIFDYDENYSIRVSVRQDEGTFDEWYGVRYSFFKKGTELWTLGSDGYSIEASSYEELLSLIERKDSLLKDRDYDDLWDDFVDELPDRIEQNGYDMYFNCADSDFITYLNNGDCNIELTIFPNEDVYTGYFTIEEYDVQCMSWELVSEGDYISPVDLIGRVKDKLNDMPRGS